MSASPASPARVAAPLAEPRRRRPEGRPRRANSRRAARSRIFRNPRRELYGRRRAGASPAGGDPRALSPLPARRRPLHRFAEAPRQGPSEAPRPRSPSATSPACSRSIWPGRATTRASSTIFCRCPTRRKPSRRSATTSIRRRRRSGRRMLLENPSTYVLFAESTISETDFLAEIARRTGCGLLLDVNNVIVSSTNHGFDPIAYLDAFPLRHVGEIHLAGYAETQDDAGRAAADRCARFAGAGWRLGALRRGDPAHRADADPDRMGQRRAGVAGRCSPRRGAPKRRWRALSPRPRRRRCAMPFEATIDAFARALSDPARPAPPQTQGREGRPDARRFAVYRNNVAVGADRRDRGALSGRAAPGRRRILPRHGARLCRRARSRARRC